MSPTRTLTYFLQHSGDVLPDLERGVVTLRRRDAGDVDLLAHSHLEALGTVLRVLAEVSTGGVRQATSVLPWLAFLNDEDRAECVRELTDVARAAVESGRLDRLEEVLYAWRATGLAAWDERQARERAPVVPDECVPIERPRRTGTTPKRSATVHA